ncbi:MAG: hypothetical protein EB125_10025, partial [Betaproteobacteria bacterium]|nr:hypothetical protein [Betaproteobacteria bacterium]
PVTAPPAEAASADGSNWVDTLTHHPLAPVGAGGLIAILVLLALWARRSGRNHDEPEDHGIQGLPPLNVKFDLNLPHGDDFDGRHASHFSEEQAQDRDASQGISMHEHADDHGNHEQGEHHEHHGHDHGYEGAHEHAHDSHQTHDDLHQESHAHHAPETSRPTLDIPNTSHYAGAQEHPFQVRMDLAEELWKLGQLHTSRALMEEVANEASGEIQAQARQWLADRG